ncbi:esterase/lipase family protein [Nocardia brasiliensis]|uniref:esterase/lipase family protein n=1 Tax=Nocardia brasiliensis TaxID=37326 RepID=UPI0004A6C5DB|nr:alpha/beta hydrolase [Nocardia brasiliensis]
MLVRVIRWAVVLCCVATGFGVVTAGAAPAPARPVLVLGGFAADAGKIETLRAWLGARGYVAYSMLLLGDPTGTAAIADSAQAVAERVAAIRRETGAARVDLVGHSMGGLAQRHFVKFLDGRAQVGTYVDYGTSEYGTYLGVACAWAAGCRDLVPGSEFLTRLNTEPALPPGLPAYHLFSTDAGEERESLPGAVNASVQAFCPGRAVSHADEPIDLAMQQLIDAALRGGPLGTDCPPQPAT